MKLFKMNKLHTLVTVILFALAVDEGVTQTRADAGADTVNCMNKGVQIGGPENSEYCYSWSPITGLDDPNTANPKANPTSKTTYTVTVTGPNFSFKETDDVEVSLLNSASFEEDPSQKYGYDDWSKNSNDPCCSGIDKDWKSVARGASDKVKVKVPSGQGFEYLHIKSNQTIIADVNPKKAASSNQTLTVEGKGTGKTEIKANCGEEDGEELEKLKVAVYTPQTFAVTVYLVHEENDDIQVIPVGQGAPNTTAITAGANGIINSSPGGDDFISGNTVSTGPDGICQTTAAGDDVQVILLSRGKRDQVCVSPGPNAFRDTQVTPSSGDDVVSGNNITTGPNGICSTAANKTNKSSTLMNMAAIQSFVNDVYKDAATSFTFFSVQNLIVNYDLNRDGRYDLSDGNPDEMNAILNASGFTKTGSSVALFFVDDQDGNTGPINGKGPFGGNVTWVNGSSSSVTNATVAHEIGHAVFRLRHPKVAPSCGPYSTDGGSNFSNDSNNIMSGAGCPRNKVRKFQWDQINP